MKYQVLAVALCGAVSGHAVAGDMVSRFDAAVGNGFPQTIAPSARGMSLHGMETLRVDAALPVHIAYDGVEQGRMYLGELNGRKAVITRLADRLEVSTRGASNVSLITYVDGAQVQDVLMEDLDDARVARTGRVDIDDGGVIGGAATRMPPPYDPDNPENPVPPPEPDRTLEFVVYRHQSMTGSWSEIRARHYDRFVADLAGSVLGRAIRLNFQDSVRGVSDFAYNTYATPEAALEAWERKVNATGIGHRNGYRFFQLLGAYNVTSSAAGIAYQYGRFSIASTGSGRTPAHEFGHNLGAEHADGETHYHGGWWCLTNMKVSDATGITNDCHHFSGKNDERIRKIASFFPE